ncbi:hypothetical protein C6501_07735 [Candidatus Poribacteria bacterium]|nr:MAG: hypothetical protein C6501_07735 [Candidatus Poribacteria bacterium]
MKQLAKTLIGIMLIVVFSALSLSASAQSFLYDFNVLEEDSWELWGDNSVWQVRDGFLRSEIQPIDFNAAFFQFKGIPGNYEKFEIFANNRLIQRQEKKPGHESFTITVNNLGSKRMNIGIAIGQRFPEISKTYLFSYVFNTYGIEAKTYKWSHASPWWKKEPRHPDVLNEILELASMEIRFNKGHFQWFVNGEKRADFEDPDFSSIEIIGFLIQSNGVHVGSGWVDSFKISGPGLSVSPQVKLTTTWGELKRY